MIRFAVLLMLAPLAAACTTTRAQMPIEHPALEVPPAPPRLIEPMPRPEAAQPEPVPGLPERTTSKPRPQAPRDGSKPENKTETVPPVEPPVQGPPATPQAVPPLRTGTVEPGEATRQVQEILGRSQTMLDKTHFQGLTAPMQALYNNAKAFIQQSRDALAAENYELARKLAEKAETIAKELQGR